MKNTYYLLCIICSSPSLQSASLPFYGPKTNVKIVTAHGSVYLLRLHTIEKLVITKVIRDKDLNILIATNCSEYLLTSDGVDSDNVFTTRSVKPMSTTVVKKPEQPWQFFYSYEEFNAWHKQQESKQQIATHTFHSKTNTALAATAAAIPQPQAASNPAATNTNNKRHKKKSKNKKDGLHGRPFPELY